MKLKINKEYESLVPRLDAEDYNSLKESIKTNGIRNKLHVLDDGTILCGHTRFRIAVELGIDNIPYEIIKLQGKTQMMLYVIDDNLSRRHLKTYQKIELGIILEPLEKKLAKERQGTRNDLKPNIVANLPPSKARDKIAKKVGVSSRTFDKGKFVIQHKPEVWERLKDIKDKNVKSIDKAYVIAKGEIPDVRPQMTITPIPEEVFRRMIHPLKDTYKRQKTWTKMFKSDKWKEHTPQQKDIMKRAIVEQIALSEGITDTFKSWLKYMEMK